MGLLGAFVQASRILVTLGGTVIPLPWGAVLTCIVLFAAIRGGTWLVMARTGGALVLIGWLAVTIALSTHSPSGDLAIAAGVRELVYLLGGTVVGAAIATFPIPRSRVTGNSDVPWDV